MSTTVITLIDAEIATLKQARAAFVGAPKKSLGRPKATPAPASAAPTKKKKRNLSPEGRARIAAAVKARWAKQKKAVAK